MFSRRKSKVPKDKRPSDRGDIPKSIIKDKTIEVSITPNKVKIPKDDKSPNKTVIKNFQEVINHKFPDRWSKIPKSKVPKHEEIEVKTFTRQKSIKKQKTQIIPTKNAQIKEQTIKGKKMKKAKLPKRPSLRKDKIQKIVNNKNKALNREKAQHPSKRDDTSSLKLVKNKRQIKKVEKAEKVKELPASRRVKVIDKKTAKVPKEKIPKDTSPLKSKRPKEKVPK